jgi:Na+/H+-dicarboxylate symporter
MAIETAVDKGKVAGATAGFVLSLGLDLNLSGSGVYYPLAVLWMVRCGGYWNALSSGTLAIIGIVSTASVIGAQHFPNYGLIMVRGAVAQPRATLLLSGRRA